MLSLLTLLFSPGPAPLPPEPPALVLLDGHDHGDHGGHGHQDRDHGNRHEDRRDDRGWREDERRDRRDEDDYWRHHRDWRKHDFHQEGRPAPPWMNTWWRPGERHYCAV